MFQADPKQEPRAAGVLRGIFQSLEKNGAIFVLAIMGPSEGFSLGALKPSALCVFLAVGIHLTPKLSWARIIHQQVCHQNMHSPGTIGLALPSCDALPERSLSERASCNSLLQKPKYLAPTSFSRELNQTLMYIDICMCICACV